jgi:hypothetical protein
LVALQRALVAKGRLPRVLLLGGVLVIAGSTSTSVAERTQEGNVIVSLNGGINPRKLPRHSPAPVTVHLAGRVSTSDGSPLPRVNWIRLEISWRGKLFRKGLAVCPAARIKNATSRNAIERCGRASVGSGRIFARVFVPKQRAFGVRARLLAFNGQDERGRAKVLIHAYATNPPVSFVIPFSVYQRKGKTVLITTIRRSVGPWPRVANFHVNVSRRFSYRGEQRSYLSASCPLPKNFTAGFLSFARATYAFDGGRELSTEAVRTCRAR